MGGTGVVVFAVNDPLFTTIEACTVKPPKNVFFTRYMRKVVESNKNVL